MKIHKRHSVSFLFAFSLFLILSAASAAVDLFSYTGEIRGAVFALEQAVFLPPMAALPAKAPTASMPRKVTGSGSIVSAEPAAAPKQAQTPAPVIVEKEEDSRETPEVLEVVEAPEIAAPVSVKPEKKPEFEQAPAVKAAAPEAVKEPAKVSTVKPAAKPVVKPAAVKPAASKPAEMKALAAAPETAPAAAPKKKIVRKAKPVIETEIPPEWNWFNTPLKAEVKNGNIELVSVEDVKPVQTVKPAAVVADEVKPFAAAEERMAQIRERRKNELKASDSVKSCEGVKRSETLLKVSAVIAEINSRGTSEAPAAPVETKAEPCSEVIFSEDDTAAETVTQTADPVKLTVEPVYESEKISEASEEEKTADVITETSPDYEFVPYYSGSGSQYSQRLNVLLRNGFKSSLRSK